MAFLGRNKSNTLEVKSQKSAKTPRALKMSRKEKKAAAEAAKAASVMSAASSDTYSPHTAMAEQPIYQTHIHHAQNEPRMGDLTVGDYANGMPRIRLGEFFNSFARQLKWLIPLFLLGTVGAWFLTKDFKRTYSGEGRVLVQLGDEYVYESVTSKQAQGLQLTPDHIVQNEVGIMKNADIIEQVVGEAKEKYGLQRFSKDAAEKEKSAAISGSAQEKTDALVDLFKEVEDSYVVMPKPKSSIVDLAYKHEDPEIAVYMLNTFIEKYLDARKALFVEGSSDIISERRRATDQQLRANERAIAKFLRENGVSDFDSERGGVTKRTEELRTQLNTLRGEMTETERALATVEQQLRATPEQIDLYVDDRASQRIAQAELELKQLLAKYLPGSPPVRQKEAELNQLKSILTTNAGKAAGGRRVGPNPVFQSTLQNRNSLQSRADSLREKEYVLQRQLDAADAKVRRMQDISPTYANLLRERDTLDERLKNYTAKEQEALVNQEQAESSSENVRVISYATRPRKGRNMRLVMFALASAGWGFTLFILAMMKVFLDPKLYASAPATTTQGRYGRREVDNSGRQDFQQPAYAPPSIPESVPQPATAFAAAPYAATGYAEPAYEDPYAAQGQAYADPQAYAAPAYQEPAYAAQSYGNAAHDIYANPYAHALQVGTAAPAAVETDMTVLGNVPTERA
jgi:uncharacterized protein involved in exopolysaccharide biosynthesis